MLINNKFYFLANGHFFSLHVLRFISLSCNFRKFYITSILFNPFQPSVVFHIKTSHLFCSAKQMTGFYMKHNTGLKWVKNFWTLSMNSKLFRGNNFFVSLKLSLLILTCFISYILLPYFMPIMYKARCQAILLNKMLRFSVLTH